MSVEACFADQQVAWTMLVEGGDLVDTCKMKKEEGVESSGSSTRSARLKISARK